ncbi:hypothetical protein [uncultured Methylobacterium sp.]|uniref:hypothetical protein n=1 Tax=uncultured Methylobacterium sp. TaxID=157278 RepID=UPI0035C982CB
MARDGICDVGREAVVARQGLETVSPRVIGGQARVSGEVARGTRLIASVMALDPMAERTGDPSTDGRVPIGVPRFQASLYGEYDVPFAKGLTLTAGFTISARNTWIWQIRRRSQSGLDLI